MGTFLRKKVLLSSSSAKLPLVRLAKDCVASFADRDLIIGDSHQFALSRFLDYDFWKMPETVDENAEEILSGCLERGVDLVFPTRDGELLFWARHRLLFANQGVEVVVSSLAGVGTCLDKLKFSEWGQSRELPFIPSFIGSPPNGEGKFVLKERFGSGGKGVFLNRSLSEILEISHELTSPIIQPFFRGPEISIDSWLSMSGDVHGLILRTRDVVLNGESQVTTTFSDQALELQARSILTRLGRDLGLRGPIVMQAILHQGQFMVVEVNARFGGASTASSQVGLHSIAWSIQERLGSPGGPDFFQRADFDVRQVRGSADNHFKIKIKI